MHVFTTRPDTIMGVTFVAVAPEHPIAIAAGARDPKVAAFNESCKQGGVTEAEMATREKDGVPTGFFVEHPISGEKVPVWVGNYVLMSYGDGAVMGVPAHDERDFAFARKFNLPIRQVIEVDSTHPVRRNATAFDASIWQDWYADKQSGVCVNSGELDGLVYADAVERVSGLLSAKGLGEKKTTWRLRDWGISRQRYWGTPIPIIHCGDCGAVPVPYEQLPVVLPEDLVPDGSGNPLNRDERFLRCSCPRCGKPARRETDTMDTFIDSSWYYMRYCSPDNHQSMVDSRNDYWMPMDQYIGGIEHAVLHLLYARFWTKVMRDLPGDFPGDPGRGLVGFDEPFSRLLCQGMVLNHIYSRKGEKGGIEYFWPEDVENVYDAKGAIMGARLKSDGSAIDYGGVGTMSKSKNNGVDPQSLIDQYGADTARLFVMFAAPPEQTLEWSGSGVEGAYRFLRRLWSCAFSHHKALAQGYPAIDAAALDEGQKALRREVYSILRQADYDYQRMQYNTVVSAAMKMLNAIESSAQTDSPQGSAVLAECLSILIRVLYPVVPHITHTLWQGLGFADRLGDLLDAGWPQVDEAALRQDLVELVLQVNGKVRGSVKVAADADRATIEQAALASEAFQRHAQGQVARKVVVVPGRLVNVVV
jgi:leucyl-tRNA synthetase